MNNLIWHLSPSDLTFLWKECRRCAYNKIVHRMQRPRMPMPSIFNKIDSAMKICFMHGRTDAIAPNLPSGVVAYADKWLESAPIPLPHRSTKVVLCGRFDTVARFDDGTYGVFDFKTSAPRAEHVTLYSRQLHAYALAAEHPAPGKFSFAPVTRLGLLVFEPIRFVQRSNNDGSINGYFGGGLYWLDVPRDDDRFLEFLSEVVGVLEQPDAPAASPECPYCTYVDLMRHCAPSASTALHLH